jgi:hypothetical protein
MERRASITSLSSAVTTKITSPLAGKLSPLIDLERFVYRFSALLRDDYGDRQRLLKVSCLKLTELLVHVKGQSSIL